MEEKDQAIAYFARKNLLAFAIANYKGFKDGYHIDLLAKKLEAVERGECKRLMVFMPPRHGKSILCSQLFPAWYLGKNPSKQIITATYGDDLARDFGRKVRNLMQEPEYKFIFPEVTLAEDSAAIGKFNTSEDGVYISTGVGGAITGRGADLLIIDDPIRNRQDADSEKIRNNVWDWYLSTARSRLMPNGAIIVIQTRWHKDDLAGRLLQQMEEGNGEDWEIVSFPAINENGEPLWPEQWSVEELLKTKSAIGQREWQCLYQQTPSDPENQIFHAEHFRYYDELPESTENMGILMTVDPAFTKKKDSDYSAIMIVGKYEDKTYVLEYSNKKLTPNDLIDEIIRLFRKWKPDRLGIESFAAQNVLGFYLQEKALSEGLPISYEEIRQHQDKVTKIKRLEPYFRNGKVLIKRHMTELEKQLLEFPQGKHDDIIDALQMSYEFRLFDIKPKQTNEEYFEDLGIRYNAYGEPIYK